MNRQLTSIFVSSLAVLFVVGCSGSATASSTTTTTGPTPPLTSGNTTAISGAGSTFVMPAMKKWAYTYQDAHKDVTVDYQSVGSGAGIAQYKAGTVDFGATDVAMSDKELADMPGATVQVPVVAGCEVMAYNLPGIGNGLKLTPEAISGMYLGKITKWSDPAIAGANPSMRLPDSAITIVHRSDGSGTTYIFTDYLSSISPDWNSGPGRGKTVNWPVGVGGKGNEGVAGDIKATAGSIGYVELAYAIQAKLTYGSIKNKSGNFVDASVDSTSAAAAAGLEAMKKDIRVSIVNGSDKAAYPIAGFTYVLLAKNPKDPVKSKVVLDFLTWCINDGQAMSKDLSYAPLPKEVVALDTVALASIQAGSK